MRGEDILDMTSGSLPGKILMFGLPLMASNVLQMLFNAADIVVVGRFVGPASLAAVGSTVPIIHMVLNLLIGISVGVNVSIARYFGEGNREVEISRTLHTSVLMALVGGAVLGAAGILFSGHLLTLVSTPNNVRPMALAYIRICFAGTPALMLYNYAAAALRATGDTRRPLLFLLFSGTLNVILNIAFVILLHAGVIGVGLATVISQVFSAVLIMCYLAKSRGVLRFSWRSLGLDRASLARMAGIGIPAGVQSCLFSLSNVVIQSAVNTYGSTVIAGCSVGENVESFLYISMNSFHHACQTFTSQNIGARRYDRVARIVRICLLYTVVLGAVLGAAVTGFAPKLIAIYNSDPAVIDAGVLRLWIVAGPYVIFGIADVLVGALRGCGFSLTPVIINLLGTCVFRVAWIALLDTPNVGIERVYLSYPISWALITVTLSVFWIFLRRRQRLSDGSV
ncbi:MATE family efflux transporter [Oscillibacter sp.]|uniref:MATE family efflux transporter n=1 Tax=Oscillibacter sp. TaxID=1945593 RepID=UPI00289EF26E|nr:MATE family efflux transporter [Oscillibacter sp.]